MKVFACPLGRRYVIQGLAALGWCIIKIEILSGSPVLGDWVRDIVLSRGSLRRIRPYEKS